MVTILLSIVVLGIAFALIGLRILLVGEGEFRGTCATNNPFLKNKIGGCLVCTKKADKPCQYDLERGASL